MTYKLNTYHTMNIREDIERAIADKCHVYEIDYLNRSEIVRCWHICNIQYSEEFGDSHIIAHVNELHKDLTFRIDRILRFDKYWVDILDENDTASTEGLYVFACRGDNHIYIEMYMMKQGELLYKYFNDEYSHCDGWFHVIPLAYHFVDINAIEENNIWDRTIENLEIQHLYGREIVVAIRDDASDCKNDFSMFRTSSNGYCFDCIGDFEQDIINGTIDTTRFVGFYPITRYSEINHQIHWTLKNLTKVSKVKPSQN